MKLPSTEELFAAAEQAGHDGLGIGSDPESLIHLANLSRRVFLDEKDVTALRDWAQTVLDIANMPELDIETMHWVDEERVKLVQASRLVADLSAEVRTNLNALQPLTGLDSERIGELNESISVSWHTDRIKVVAAEG